MIFRLNQPARLAPQEKIYLSATIHMNRPLVHMESSSQSYSTCLLNMLVLIHIKYNTKKNKSKKTLDFT
jgi:hypothetical protein